MDRREIIARLRENEGPLRERGIRHAALFGSCARGEERPDSDIDIMIEVDPAARIGVYEYVAIKDYIAGLFDTRIDVVRCDRLKPYVRPAAVGDAIYDPASTRRWLNDIRSQIELVQRFLGDRDYEAFKDDQLRLYAVTAVHAPK